MDAFFSMLSGRLDLLTWTGLLLFLSLSVMLGWIVPRWIHNRIVQKQEEANQKVVEALTAAHSAAVDALTAAHSAAMEGLVTRYNEVVAEKNEWRGVAEVRREEAQEIRAQNRMLLEQGQTNTYVFEQIRRGLTQAAEKDEAQ